MQHDKFISKPPFSVSTCVFDKARSIRLALFDVDGVMTNGTIYFDQHGEALKAFNVLDGQGLKLLQKSGVEVGVISARKSPALQQRIDNLGIQHAFTGVDNKLATFDKLRSSLNIMPEHCCFTGDDIIDIEVMRACGLSFSVDNAHYSAKNIADWVAPQQGGHGAVRAICDIILFAQHT